MRIFLWITTEKKALWQINMYNTCMFFENDYPHKFAFLSVIILSDCYAKYSKKQRK